MQVLTRNADAMAIKRQLARCIAPPLRELASNDEVTIGDDDRHGGHRHRRFRGSGL